MHSIRIMLQLAMGILPLLLMFAPATSFSGLVQPRLPLIPFQHISQNPYKGAFLVADPKMFDDRFSETVVLMTHDDHSGSVGIIINRPTQTSLSHAFPGIEEFDSYPDVLYGGGPVQPETMTLILRTDDHLNSVEHVFDNVYFGTVMETLRTMLKSENKGDAIRVYAGHAGWAPGQLEREIDHGWWRVIRGDSVAIFDMDPSSVWSTMIKRSSQRWVNLKPKVLPSFEKSNRSPKLRTPRSHPAVVILTFK